MCFSSRGSVVSFTLQHVTLHVTLHLLMCLASKRRTIQAYFVLRSPIVRQVSLLLEKTEVLQGIAAGIGISNIIRAFIIIFLNSLSSGSMN